jgi:hypothetical protein
MHDIFSREPDPLDGMLAPPSPSDTDALQQDVYARTRRVLRRGRRLRQVAYFAVMLHAFLGGMGTMYAVLRPVPAPDEPAHSASKEASQPPATAPDVPALAREWEAFDSDNRRAELYRLAAERYLKEEDDLLSAVRCYGNSLDSGTERDRAVSADDDYLLMAIKIARQKEKNDAKNDG